MMPTVRLRTVRQRLIARLPRTVLLPSTMTIIANRLRLHLTKSF
jgi:hypothetical protein